MSWLTYLIQAEESDNQDNFKKSKLLLRTTVIFSIVGVLYGTLYATRLNFIVGAKFLYTMSVVNLFGIALFYFTQNVRIAGNYLSLMLGISLVFLSYHSGGLYASSNSWFSILVLVSLLISGYRSSIFWGVAALIYLGVLVKLTASGHAFPELYAEGTEIPRQLIGFGGSVILTYILAAIFERNKRAAYLFIDDLLNNTIQKLEKTREEIAVTVIETAEKATHCANYSTEVNDRFVEMNTGIKQINENLNTIVINVKNTESTIHTAESLTIKNHERVILLKNKSKEIEKIADLIRSITSQVNLLSLNASVEAVRAGSAGVSFAVVADEIKNLAHKTTESTESIEKTLKSIQEEIDGVTKDMKKLNTIISDISVKQTDITKAVEKQADITHVMKDAVVLSTKQEQEITQLIHQLSDSANQLLVKTNS